jgi:predicted transcriptional regulator
MTTANVERAKVRLSLDVSPELNDLLEQLARETHATKSDVLRKAIALMDVAVEAKERGQKLYVSEQAPAGPSREIVGI